VYDEYLDQLSVATAEQLSYQTVSLVDPRNRVDKILGRLSLLS
jgi:hypothetical protein